MTDRCALPALSHPWRPCRAFYPTAIRPSAAIARPAAKIIDRAGLGGA